MNSSFSDTLTDLWRSSLRTLFTFSLAVPVPADFDMLLTTRSLTRFVSASLLLVLAAGLDSAFFVSAFLAGWLSCLAWEPDLLPPPSTE